MCNTDTDILGTVGHKRKVQVYLKGANGIGHRVTGV